MVFLTSIDILDTGFISKTDRTSQLEPSDRVNSGSALRLKGVELDMSGSSNTDNEGSPGNYTNPTAQLISINGDEIELTLYINSNNVDTNNVWGINDMSLFEQAQ